MFRQTSLDADSTLALGMHSLVWEVGKFEEVANGLQRSPTADI